MFTWRDALVLPLLVVLFPIALVTISCSLLVFIIGGDWTKDQIISIRS